METGDPERNLNKCGTYKIHLVIFFLVFLLQTLLYYPFVCLKSSMVYIFFGALTETYCSTSTSAWIPR